MVGNYFTTQEKLRIIVIVVYIDQDSLFSFQIILPALTAFRRQLNFRPPAEHNKLKYYLPKNGPKGKP